MAKPLDTAQQGAKPSAADDGVHKVFVRDLLDEMGSEFTPTPSSLDTKPTTLTDGRGSALPAGFPSASLFDFISGVKNFPLAETLRASMSAPLLDAGDVSGAQKNGTKLPVLDVVGLNPKSKNGSAPQKESYKSHFGKSELSYLDPIDQLRVADATVAKPSPAARIDKENAEKEKKEEAPPAQSVEIAPPPKVVPVVSADGRWTYERTASGDWQAKDKTGATIGEHSDLPGKKITGVEAQLDGSVKITVDGGQVLRETTDGGRSIYPDDDAFKANHPSELAGRLKNIVWDGDKIKSFHSVRTNADWYQVGDNIWANSPNTAAGWHGKVEIDGKTGVFSRTTLSGAEQGLRDESRANGINESYKPDGSMSVEVPYPDKTKFSFKFKETFGTDKDVLKQPEEIKIAEKDGAETIWKKTGPTEYTSSSGAKWNTEVEVKRDGTYSYKDVDGGERAVRTLSGHYEKENLKDKTLVEKESGKITRVKVGDDDVQIEYAADGSTSEIRHVNKNLKLTRAADGSFSDSAIDSAKPYAKLEKFEADIYTHNDLDAFQKIRLIDNVTKFREMSKFSSTEKDKVFKEADRLLHGRTDSVMTSAEKANYADQLFWHIANDRRNDQGSNSTCSVTALRGIALKEKPSVVAKLAADFANDGQFETLDGTTIKPKLESVRVRPGSPEETFPPKPGSRSALGKLWDVCAVNISMQRDTKDPLGSVCSKGAMCYEEVAPTGRSDSGARLIRTNSDGSQLVLYSSKNGTANPYDSPRVGFPSRIADIWNQMTGDKLTDRFLVHQNRWVDNETTFKDLVGAKQKSVQELEAMLLKNDLPKITQGNTGVLEYRYRQQVALNEGKDPNAVAKPAGGEHLFLVTGYDAASKTVSVDNSWNPLYDVQTKAEAAAQGKDLNKTVFITLNDLYEVMSSTSSGDGSTFVWYRR